MIRNQFTSIFLAVVILICAIFSYKKDTYALDNNDNIRACWISYLDIQIYLKDLSEEEFKLKVIDMYNTVLSNNLNTVIVQVRAMCDAIYPSELFPWSAYISTDRIPPEYDPLKIMVDIAETMGLRFEAWINPYRVSLNTTTTNSFKTTSYYQEYKEFIMEYSNSSGEVCLSLDPSREESVQLICEGVKEILQTYEVDAIHFDDYFYVSGMAPQLSVEMRQEYVNHMVKTVYDSIKNIDKNCELGISPAGNIENAMSQGADVETWLSKEGYLDYIMPQIYWTDTYITNEGVYEMFTRRCEEWQAINHLNKPMYIGLALYRVGEVSTIDMGWSMSDSNLKNQYISALSLGCDGYALFRYEWLELSVSENELFNLFDYVGELNTYPYVSYSKVSYTVNDGDGWEIAKKDGIVAGSRINPITAIVITVGEELEGVGVLYKGLDKDRNWSGVGTDGAICKLEGGMMGFCVSLSGERKEEYDIIYRCYINHVGWSNWCKNGEEVYSESEESYISGIQIKILKKVK